MYPEQFDALKQHINDTVAQSEARLIDYIDARCNGLDRKLTALQPEADGPEFHHRKE